MIFSNNCNKSIPIIGEISKYVPPSGIITLNKLKYGSVILFINLVICI